VDEKEKRLSAFLLAAPAQLPTLGRRRYTSQPNSCFSYRKAGQLSSCFFDALSSAITEKMPSYTARSWTPRRHNENLHLLQLPLLRTILGATKHLQSFYVQSSSLHAFHRLHTSVFSITMPVKTRNMEAEQRKHSDLFLNPKLCSQSPGSGKRRQRKLYTKGIERRNKWNTEDYLLTSEKVHKI
jgi:hypothetical protein